MNTSRKSLKKEIWRLVLIPSLAMCLFIGACAGLLFTVQFNKYIDLRGATLAEKTASLLSSPLRNNQLDTAQEILDASIEEPFIRATHLVLANNQHTLHSGPRFWLPEDSSQAALHQATRRDGDHTIVFSHPIAGSQNGEPLGWIELELLASPYFVIHQQAILLTLSFTLLGLLLVGYLAMRLYRSILTPLEQLDNTATQISRGKYDARAQAQTTHEFSGIAASINAMADAIEDMQQTMQNETNSTITELRESMDALEIRNVELDLARKAALESSRIKSEFLTNTSHEIRTPLNGILGFINLALKTDLSEKQRSYLDTIRDSAQNLLTAINSILDFSKIETGKLTLDYAPLNLRKCIDETLHLLAPDAHDKALQLIPYIEPRIPHNLLGDGLRFQQVLNNLVANAIKFSSKGNITIEVGVVEYLDAQIRLKISVTDQGIGLSHDDKALLFDNLGKIDNSNSREHDGTGLGLAISKGLVERMQGTIGVTSNPEQGSTFWFTALLGVDRRQPLPSPYADLSDYRMLLCSDQPDSRRQLELLLHEWNANTHCINAVHDCFMSLRQARDSHKPFDVLLLDIAPSERKIPPMLLNNLALQLQEEFHCHLVVCCTEAHRLMFRRHSELQGSQLSAVFIDKPIAYDTLLNNLGRLLNIHVKEIREPQVDEHRLNPPNILLVDDNPANLQLASELLRGLGTDVISVGNGPQAIEQCQQQVFDIIFMDIQMPGMDGIETTRHIRNQEDRQNRTPIIALTAHSITEQKSELLIAGMDDCISKPVSETQLAHIINRWVDMEGKKPLAVGSTLVRDPSPRPAPSITTNELGAVDLQLCLKLANFKAALARDMLSMLLENLPQEKIRLQQNLAQQDYNQLGEQIHSLYGSSCYCGVPKLKYISGLLDKLLNAKLHSQVQDAIPALYHAIDELILWQEDKDINALFGLDESSVLEQT